MNLPKQAPSVLRSRSVDAGIWQMAEIKDGVAPSQSACACSFRDFQCRIDRNNCSEGFIPSCFIAFPGGCNCNCVRDPS